MSRNGFKPPLIWDRVQLLVRQALSIPPNSSPIRSSQQVTLHIEPTPWMHKWKHEHDIR